jgi:hypothetical protein
MSPLPLLPLRELPCLPEPELLPDVPDREPSPRLLLLSFLLAM